jgi:hypothetical protein
MSDAVLGAIILVPLVVAIYFVARLVAAVGDAWGAHQLAPLAPTIGGVVSRDGPHVDGSYRGLRLRVFATTDNIGSGETGTRMNAIKIEVPDLDGHGSWRIAYHPTSWLGPNRELFIEVPDTALGDRINGCGALEAIAAVNTPSESYVAVAYDARERKLTYTDDVSPRRVPKTADFARQLDLVVRLVEINTAANRAVA